MRSVLLAALSLAFLGNALGNPTGGAVSSGSATISSSGSTLTVNSSTSSTIINWNSFSVGAGETVRFNQPSASSTVLNRVTGPDSSTIAGSLTSNGGVFLVNANGVVFAPGSQIDVASLLVTSQMSDASFLSGNFSLSGGSFIVTGQLPSGTLITSGNATITTGSTMNITQGSTTGVTTWGSFGVSGGTTAGGGNVSLTGSSLTGMQPSGGAVLLRSGSGVPTPSQIQGVLAVQSSASRPGAVTLNFEKREVPF